MAGLGGRIPNFDGLLDDDQPKDTEVTILEEDTPTANSGNKRSRQGTSGNHITMQAHRIVLRSLSPYFQTKLERWSRGGTATKKPRTGRQHQDHHHQQQQQQEPPPYQYSLQLLVPRGQLELGRRLITAMYSSSPDLSDLEAPQLMQLLALAECYGVGKVVADAAGQLHTLSTEAMPLEIAAAVFELPEACLQLEAVQQVQQAAADKLQQQLGDLEVTWGDNKKQQQLLGLPFGALLHLLKDDRTQVASEDTAVYTAQHWLDKAYSAGPKQQQQQQQQQQLARVLRAPQCTGTFLARLALDDDMGWLYDDDTGLLEDLMAVAGRSTTYRDTWVQIVTEDWAAWRLEPRPVSAVTQVHLSWDLPLDRLEEELAADPGEHVVLECDSSVVWQGRRWWLSVEYTPGGDLMDAYVLHKDAPAYLTAKFQLEVASGRGRRSRQFSLDREYTRGSIGEAVATWGPGREEWAQVRAWLQEKGLVHPDGCLHLRATITHVE